MLKARARKLEAKYGIKIPPDLDEIGWKMRILPYGKAPVVIQEGGERRLELMQFSLLPSWSKEKRVKFATHNARLDGIESKPTWRKPFADRHCLVPITHFIEPIYTGEFASQMVSFSRKDEEILTAAGLWMNGSIQRPERSSGPLRLSLTIHPRLSRRSGTTVVLFSFRTPKGPLPFPLGLSLPKKTPVSAQKSWLLSHRADPSLQVESDRPLKPGWEKRR